MYLMNINSFGKKVVCQLITLRIVEPFLDICRSFKYNFY